MVARSALETERRDATALDDAALADLAQHFRGQLIRPGDAQYDAARAIWSHEHRAATDGGHDGRD